MAEDLDQDSCFVLYVHVWNYLLQTHSPSRRVGSKVMEMIDQKMPRNHELIL
ncbi:MAG: hypothetical protein OXE59_00535 [Bacteroidetes bacterium]|nr:hypothetical protein [Bacteroidota bacterium]MCY4232222.1 hypothetical protein [Bacteroidota bacterium]